MKNYGVLINPFVKYESLETNEDYEDNISFPQFKSLISRPNEIQVNYTDGNNEQQSQDLEGSEAREFLQHWDMLMGSSILWWYRNHGNLWVKEE